MSERRRYETISGLKGIFTFIIVLVHTLPDPLTPSFARIPLTSFIGIYGGDLGNCMFFLLSGFLLSYGYRQRIGDQEIAFKDYIMRRLGKLYFPYILSNIAVFVVFFIKHGPSIVNIQRIVFTAILQVGGVCLRIPIMGLLGF